MIRDAAFHPDGRTLIGLTDRSRGNATQLLTWNLADGSLSQDFFVQEVQRPLRWTSPVHVMAGKKLVNVLLERSEWSYTQGLHEDTSCGLGFYQTTDSSGQTCMAAITMPSDFVAAAIKSAQQKRSLQVGDSLNLTVQVPDDHPRSEKLRDQMSENFRKRLKTSGKTIDFDQPTTLAIAWSKSDNNSFFKIRQGEKETLVPNVDLVAKVQLKSSSGSEYWSRETRTNL
ncbi:MAG: hypothetical protein VX768_18045 [Planctomycetota bacterium]|nr:hypothetical protein [Planctomycetota bacterium]